MQNKKILIIEDDMFLGEILTRSMVEGDIQAVRVRSAEEAFTELAHTIPDYIVLDIYLPGMSGLDFLDKLKKDEKTKSIPVMVVSNASTAEERSRAETLGASFFVKALVSPQDIINNLKKALGSAK